MVLELSETVAPVEIKAVLFKFLGFKILLFCCLDFNGKIKGESLISIPD